MIRSIARVLFGPKKVVEDARGDKIVPELPLVRDSRLIGPHRAEELISDGDAAIVSGSLIDFLSKEPWNSEALERLARVNTGLYRDLLLADALKAKPAESRILEEIVRNEADRFLSNETPDIETLVTRLERIFFSESLLQEDGTIDSLFRIIEEKYDIDPFQSRDVALSIIRTMVRFSDSACLDLFGKLKRNMVDNRIRRVVLGSSKREGRYFLSLEQLDCFEQADERDFERHAIQQSILEIMFNGEMEEIILLLGDVLPPKSGRSRLVHSLEAIAPFSEEIFNFVNGSLAEIGSESGLEEEIGLLRNVLSGKFSEGVLLLSSSYERGDYTIDLMELPLYTIRSRIIEEIESGIGLKKIASSSKRTMSETKISARRKLEILLSTAREIRPLDKVLALEFLISHSEVNEGDERITRLKARLMEEVGDIDGAIASLEGLEQPSSLGLHSQLLQTKEWLKNGYDLDSLGDHSGGFVPEEMSVMYNVHSALPFITSGYTIRTREVASKLSEMGLKLDVFARWGFPLDRIDLEFDESVEIADEISDSGVSYSFSADKGGMKKHKFEEYCRRAAESILERAKKKKPMAIISASDASIGLASSMAARSLGVPFIYEMRGIWAMTRAANNPGFEVSTRYDLMMRLEKQCALSAYKVLTISDEMKKLVESWGVDGSRIIVVPNGASKEVGVMTTELDRKESRIGTRERPIVFGYLGSMVPYEGLENLVSAAEIMKKRRLVGFKFVLVGDGKSRSDIKELIIEKKLQEVIELRGKIPNEEVPKFYSEVDVVVLPRLGFPVCEIVPALKPLEAMSYGKCVICSNVGPARELISHGENGLLFEKSDVRELVKLLVSLKKNPEVIGEIGRAGKEMVASERGWDKLLSEVSETLHTIQFLKESESKLPNTNTMTEIVERVCRGEEAGTVKRMRGYFNKIIPQARGARMRRNTFLSFLRAIGNTDPGEGVLFFFENEEIADKRSVRSAITYCRRAGHIDSIHLLIRRYGDDLDEEFVKRFDDAISKSRKSESGIFVWPTNNKNLDPNRPKVACILDRFSYDSLKFEFDLHPIPRKSYETFFDENKFDFVFMESFWASHNDDWRFAMSSNNSPMGDELNNMIEFVKERGIKTVFWNKEDPINYDTFIQSAKRFDYVFTSDVNIIPRYVEDCGHERVFPLEFACEPRLHNPIRNRLGEEKDLSFAGAWYARGHENRKEQIRMLLDASMDYQVDVFDRFFDDDSPNKFPKKYQRFVRGSLSYDEARTTYRMYKAVMNVNTIQDSPTMFSRRVYEVLASSSYVISTPSLGVKESFQHGVSVVNSTEEAKIEIDRILGDKMYREREAHLGYRKVMTEDTYRKRVKFICDTIGMKTHEQGGVPLVSLICVTNRPDMIDNIMSNFKRQNYPNLELIVCITASNADYKRVKEKVMVEPRARVVRVGASLKMGPCLNRGFSKAKGDYLGKFDDDDYYGSNYVSDQILCFSYTNADIVGKTSIFMYNGQDGCIYRRYPKSAHKFQNLVLGPTLMMKKEVFERMQFRDVGLGEDTNFLRDAAKLKMRIYAADPFNFMYIRRASGDFHSWNPEQDELLRGAEYIEKTEDWTEIIDF